MRKFNIKVNGNSYEVEVEEVGGSVSYAPGAPAAPASTPVAAPAPAAPAAPAAPKASTGAGSIKVESPMPGTILKVNVKVGDKVDEGQAVIMLEAMKMENEIVAPKAGTVASIDVNQGDSVNSGDVLITLN